LFRIWPGSQSLLHRHLAWLDGLSAGQRAGELENLAGLIIWTTRAAAFEEPDHLVG